MSLKLKVEQAWAAVVASLAGVPTMTVGGKSVAAVFKGADASEIVRDRVVVACLGGPEPAETLGLGNRMMVVAVRVVTGVDENGEEGDDAEARHEANCSAVFDGLEKHAGLAAALSAAVDDFHCFDPVIPEGEEPEEEERGWVEGRLFTCYCCGVDLA